MKNLIIYSNPIDFREFCRCFFSFNKAKNSSIAFAMVSFFNVVKGKKPIQKTENLFGLSILSVLLLVVGSVAAQQLPHYSQYVDNLYAFNPAVAGSEAHFEANLNNRFQWVGVQDAPRTYVFSLHGPLNDKMGAGGVLFNDIVGPTRRTGLKLSYAYHLKLNDTYKVALGVSAGALQYATDFSKITFNASDDPAVTSILAQVTIPDFGAGVYLYSDDLYVSISSPQFFPSKVQYFEKYAKTGGKLVNHFYASAGYKIHIGDVFTVQPAFLIKYVQPVKMQLEGTLRLLYKDAFWVGASYRAKDAIVLMGGVLLKDNIMFGYSYDMITSGMKNFSSGTHELMLGIRFNQSNNGTAAKTKTPAVEGDDSWKYNKKK